MRVSSEVLKIVIVQHLERDNDLMSEGKIIVLPCRDEKQQKNLRISIERNFLQHNLCLLK